MTNSSLQEFNAFEFEKFSLSSLKTDKLISGLIDNREKIVQLASLSTQTPMKYHQRDFDYALDFLNKLPNLFKNFLSNNQSDFLKIIPKGNIFIVLSANEPFILSIIPTISALCLGNNIYVKPASQNYDFVLAISKIINSSLESNRFKVCEIKKKDIEKLAKSRNINQVYWFGSVSTIRKVGPVFMSQPIEFVYECEGNDYIFVSNNSDLELASNIIVHSLTTHNGQCCNAIKGVLVGKKNYSNLKSKLISKIKHLSLGNYRNKSTDISHSQFLKETVTLYVDDLIKRDKNKEWIEIYKKGDFPLFVSGVSKKNNVLRRTVFGPLIWLMLVDSIKEVVKFANDSEYGIGFTIISESKNEIDLATKLIWYSRISINKDPLDISPDNYWGGIRKSGVGGSKSWFEKFANYKYISK